MIPTSRSAAVVLTAILLSPAAARAQTPGTSKTCPAPLDVRAVSCLAEGTVVRVRTVTGEPRNVTGVLLRADTLVSLRLESGEQLDLAPRNVRRMDAARYLRRGLARPHRGRKVGTVVGLVPSVVGLGGGMYLDTMIGVPAFTAVAVVGGFVFTGITSGVGALFDRRRHSRGRLERTWTRVRLPVATVPADTAVVPAA